MARRVSGVTVRLSVAGGEPRYLRFAVRDLTHRLGPHATLGIARPYPRPWIEQSELAGLSIGGEALTPGAAKLARSLLTLPTHQFVGESDIAATGHRAVHLTLQRVNDWMVDPGVASFLEWRRRRQVKPPPSLQFQRLCLGVKERSAFSSRVR
jgi:hypothetical protein